MLRLFILLRLLHAGETASDNYIRRNRPAFAVTFLDMIASLRGHCATLNIRRAHIHGLSCFNASSHSRHNYPYALHDCLIHVKLSLRISQSHRYEAYKRVHIRQHILERTVGPSVSHIYLYGFTYFSLCFRTVGLLGLARSHVHTSFTPSLP